MKNVKTHKVTITRKFSWLSFKKEYRWRIDANNGENIAISSEGFVNKRDCIYNAKTTAKSILQWAGGNKNKHRTEEITDSKYDKKVYKKGYRLIKKYPGISNNIEAGDVIIKDYGDDHPYSSYRTINGGNTSMFERTGLLIVKPEDHPEYFQETEIEIAGI